MVHKSLIISILSLQLFIMTNTLSSFPTEKKIVNLHKEIVQQLDKCTLWRKNIDKEDQKVLDDHLLNSRIDDFREKSIELSFDNYQETLACIENLSKDIEIYRNLKTNDVSGNREGLDDFITSDQQTELYNLMLKTDRSDLITKSLRIYLNGLSEHRKREIIDEFFSKIPIARLPRSLKDDYEEPSAREPEPLNNDWLLWQTKRQQMQMKKAASKWDEMNIIADQFYHLRKSLRKNYESNLIEYCHNNLRKIIGEDNFKKLEVMYTNSEQTEHIDNKFHVIIGNLDDEIERLTADHYGQFCRKIYRLVPFEHADFMSWLKPIQKLQIAEMIQDPSINDSQVYEKLYQFFNDASGDTKEEADEVIASGCRRFIAHHLGDQLGEEIEEMRASGNTSAQYNAAFLTIKHNDLGNIDDSPHKKRVDESLSICKRIYLNYDGSCDCNGMSENCDPSTHVCRDCTGHTTGYQCESCIKHYARDMTTLKCVQVTENSCDCNNHSNKCTKDEKCLDCQHNTTGDQCEMCLIGFYGVATKGTETDCVECPCPKGGECWINSESSLECVDCPKGYIGESCDVEISLNKTEVETKTGIREY